MKIAIATMVSLATVLVLSGCSGSDDTTENTDVQKNVTVTYANGEVIGITCGDYISNNDASGLNICEQNTQNIIGFFHIDATVTNLGGEVVGECTPDFDIGLIESDTDVTGTCTLTVNNPAVEAPATTETSRGSTTSPTTTETSGGSTTTTATNTNDGSASGIPEDGVITTDTLNTSQQGAPSGLIDAP